MLNKCCISINAKCNLSCVYCHFYENDNLDMADIRALNTQKLDIILHNILTYAQNENIARFTIGFAGGGEPLLDWNMLETALKTVIAKDQNHQLSFYIITNGMLINERFLLAYKDLYNSVKLVVSVDGDKITHDTLRVDKNHKGTHDRIMQNIALFQNMFHKVPGINLSISRLSLDRRKHILDFLLQYNFTDITFTRLFHCNDKMLEITQKEFLEFIDFFASYQFNIRNIAAKDQEKCDCIMYGHICGVGYNNIFYCNDKAYPCMRFVENNKSIGNYNDSLSSIIQNMQSLRQPLEKLIGVCHYDKY